MPIDAVSLPNTTTSKADPVIGATQGLGLRRNAGEAASAPASHGNQTAELPDNYLDIPAFLRRQAD
jgi:cell division protein FtsZ